MNAANYPPDWKAISRRIRARDGNECACVGQCGDPHETARCEAPNGVLILRHRERPALWRRRPETCSGEGPAGFATRAVRVVLTVAHLDHDTQNNDDSNLLSLCQRCHLRLDREQHADNTRRTVATKLRARRSRHAVGDLFS